MSLSWLVDRLGAGLNLTLGPSCINHVLKNTHILWFDIHAHSGLHIGKVNVVCIQSRDRKQFEPLERTVASNVRFCSSCSSQDLCEYSEERI